MYCVSPSTKKGGAAGGSTFKPEEVNQDGDVTYPRRFYHPRRAVAPATDTDIGPPLSAPRSRTGSWPCCKCEGLVVTKETRHISASWCPERKRFDRTIRPIVGGNKRNKTHCDTVAFQCFKDQTIHILFIISQARICFFSPHTG